MKYVKKDFGSYKLHMIKTNKFKTIKIRVSFRNQIKKDEITMRNILSNILTYSSNKYKTKRDLILESQNLYDASIYVGNSRYGNYINTNINLTVLNDKYTEEGNYKKSLYFLNELIYNPNVSDNKFNKEVLSIVKKNCFTSLESIKEDTTYYSIIRLYEVMDEESPLSYRMCGYINDLDKINSSNLYAYYKNMINKDLMDIFVVGDIDFFETEELIKEIFPVKTFKKKRVDYYLPEKKARGKRLFAKEQDENLQSKLAIGCRCYGLSSYEKNYPLTLYNIILGVGSDSKLFREVREANSLCYDINSVLNKLDNTLVIRAGVNRKNVKKTIDLSNTQMNLMRKGKFGDDVIEKAKEFFSTSLDSMLESQSNIIDFYFMMDILKLDDLEVRRKKMAKVTKAEIVKVAKKVKMDTIYCLEGVKE